MKVRLADTPAPDKAVKSESQTCQIWMGSGVCADCQLKTELYSGKKTAQRFTQEPPQSQKRVQFFGRRSGLAPLRLTLQV